jgi:hypothetical protein
MILLMYGRFTMDVYSDRTHHHVIDHRTSVREIVAKQGLSVEQKLDEVKKVVDPFREQGEKFNLSMDVGVVLIGRESIDAIVWMGPRNGGGTVTPDRIHKPFELMSFYDPISIPRHDGPR